MSTEEQLQAQIQTLEKMVEKYEQGHESFAVSVNEVNNQLAVLKGHAQLAASATDAVTRELVTVILSSVSRIQNLLRSTADEFPRNEPVTQILQTSAKPESVSILVVDDESMIRGLLKSLLSKLGYGVSTASSGGEAIELCAENRYDIILMDYRLGDMNGLDVFNQVRPGQKTSRVVFLTGDPNIAELQTAVHNAGADGFITKPFEVNEIEVVVEHLLQIPVG